MRVCEAYSRGSSEVLESKGFTLGFGNIFPSWKNAISYVGCFRLESAKIIQFDGFQSMRLDFIDIVQAETPRRLY